MAPLPSPAFLMPANNCNVKLRSPNVKPPPPLLGIGETEPFCLFRRVGGYHNPGLQIIILISPIITGDGRKLGGGMPGVCPSYTKPLGHQWSRPCDPTKRSRHASFAVADAADTGYVRGMIQVGRECPEAPGSGTVRLVWSVRTSPQNSFSSRPTGTPE